MFNIYCKNYYSVLDILPGWRAVCRLAKRRKKCRQNGNAKFKTSMCSMSTRYIFDRARPKRRQRFNDPNVVLTTFPAMTTVLKERMSEGMRAERAPSNPRPRGWRRSCSVKNILCRRFASRHICS